MICIPVTLLDAAIRALRLDTPIYRARQLPDGSVEIVTPYERRLYLPASVLEVEAEEMRREEQASAGTQPAPARRATRPGSRKGRPAADIG